MSVLKKYTALLMLVFPALLHAQQEFGKDILKTLCSPEFHGRGYVNDGHIIASKFIASKFDEFGLEKFEDSYFQKFDIKANTFPDSVSVAIDGYQLETGKEYIVDAVSGSAKGTYELIWVNTKNIGEVLGKVQETNQKGNANIAWVVDTKGIENRDSISQFHQLAYYIASAAPVVWITDTKFTWSVGREELTYPIIEIKRENIPWTSETITLNINNKFHEKLQTQNVIGYVKGKKKCKYLVISAHYDHLGRMGANTYFPGANDNASGVAMLLYLAKYFSEHKPKYNIVFMAFGAEEAGILGSKHYVDNPLFPLKKIEFLVNCDIMGTGDEGITVVNGTLHKEQFKRLAIISNENEYLAKVKVRGQAANSDHYWFTQAKVPAIFMYTMGGIKAYHDVYDKSETLPLTEFNDLSKLLIEYLQSF